MLLRKLVDSTSPLFAQAFSINEMFESVVFQFVPTNFTAGTPPAIFNVRLSAATIASYRHFFAETPSVRYVGFQLLEEIAFFYQKIEWGFNDRFTAAIVWPAGP